MMVDKHQLGVGAGGVGRVSLWGEGGERLEVRGKELSDGEQWH